MLIPHLFSRKTRFDVDVRWECDVVYVKPVENGDAYAIHTPDGREIGRCEDRTTAHITAAAHDLVALSVH